MADIQLNLLTSPTYSNGITQSKIVPKLSNRIYAILRYYLIFKKVTKMAHYDLKQHDLVMPKIVRGNVASLIYYQNSAQI